MCVCDLYRRLVNKHLPKRMNTINCWLALSQLDTIVCIRDYEMLCVSKHSEPQSFILLSFCVVATSWKHYISITTDVMISLVKPIDFSPSSVILLLEEIKVKCMSFTVYFPGKRATNSLYVFFLKSFFSWKKPNAKQNDFQRRRRFDVQNRKRIHSIPRCYILGS
jgi:hypothetical protein